MARLLKELDANENTLTEQQSVITALGLQLQKLSKTVGHPPTDGGGALGGSGGSSNGAGSHVLDLTVLDELLAATGASTGSATKVKSSPKLGKLIQAGPADSAITRAIDTSAGESPRAKRARMDMDFATVADLKSALGGLASVAPEDEVGLRAICQEEGQRCGACLRPVLRHGLPADSAQFCARVQWP